MKLLTKVIISEFNSLLYCLISILAQEFFLYNKKYEIIKNIILLYFQQHKS